MEFSEIMRKRYAAKKFTGEKITPEQLQKLKDAIRLSPSSFNVQPWKVVIIDDEETKQKLLPESYNQQQIPTCSHLFVFCRTDVPQRFEALYDVMKKAGVPDEKVEGFRNATQGSIAKKTPEQLAHYAELQCYIPLMSLMAQATELRLDSCPMGGFSAEGYIDVLGLKDIVPVVLCPVGFGEGTQREKIRFPEEDVFVSLN